MVNKDNFNILKYDQMLDPIAKTVTFNSGSADIQGFESVSIVVLLGLAANNSLSAAKTWSLVVEESINDSDWTTVDADDLIAVSSNAPWLLINAADEDNAIYAVGYIGNNRYIRIVATAAGSPGSMPMAIFATEGHPRSASTGQATGP